MGQGKTGYNLNTKGGRESFNASAEQKELADEEKKSGQLLLFEDEEASDALIKTETNFSESIGRVHFMHSGGEGFSSKSETSVSSAYVNGRDYNSAGSASVKRVESVQIAENTHSLPVIFEKNTVLKSYKKGGLESERYYGADGKPYLDIDYTDHGNAKKHPIVPHEHKIEICDNGIFVRSIQRRIK